MLKIAFDPVYAHPLPENHRFPMLKYELIPEQLMHEGTITTENMFSPLPCTDETVLLTHTKAYVDDLSQLKLSPSHIRRIGFPLTDALVLRERVITQGTIDCCNYAMQYGIALNVAGGTHHAFADRGEGFCIFNDMAVAASHLLHRKLVKQIMIIDLDVHQGNGTASIFSNNPSVFTFSMHGGHNYPFHKEISDLDVPLEDGTDDNTYLSILSYHLEQLFDQVKPDFVFYLSGVDVLETDRYGKLKLTLRGCKQRDEMVIQSCRQRNLPCTIAMGGGYSKDVKVITEAHCQTYRAAANIYEL